MLNLQNGTYHAYKKPSNKLLYIHSLSNHPPQIIKQLSNSISEKLSKNSCSQEIFNTAKVEYEDAKSGYNVDLKYNNNKLEKPKMRKRNKAWFSPPFSKSISTNVAMTFLQLVTKCFPRTNIIKKSHRNHEAKVQLQKNSGMSNWRKLSS